MHQGESSQQGRQFEKGESSRAGGGGGEVSVQGDRFELLRNSLDFFMPFYGDLPPIPDIGNHIARTNKNLQPNTNIRKQVDNLKFSYLHLKKQIVNIIKKINKLLKNKARDENKIQNIYQNPQHYNEEQHQTVGVYRNLINLDQEKINKQEKNKEVKEAKLLAIILDLSKIYDYIYKKIMSQHQRIEIGESSQQGIVEDGNALHNRFNQINKKVLELLENYGNIPSPLYINHHLPSEILSLNNPNNSIREQYNNLILTYKYFIEANIMNIEYENNILQNIINAKNNLQFSHDPLMNLNNNNFLNQLNNMLKETEEYKNINKNCKKIIIDDLLRIYNYIFNNYLKNPQEEKQEGQAKRTREMHESEQDRRVRGRIGSGSGSKNN